MNSFKEMQESTSNYFSIFVISAVLFSIAGLFTLLTLLIGCIYRKESSMEIGIRFCFLCFYFLELGMEISLIILWALNLNNIIDGDF